MQSYGQPLDKKDDHRSMDECRPRMLMWKYWFLLGGIFPYRFDRAFLRSQWDTKMWIHQLYNFTIPPRTCIVVWTECFWEALFEAIWEVGVSRKFYYSIMHPDHCLPPSSQNIDVLTRSNAWYSCFLLNCMNKQLRYLPTIATNDFFPNIMFQ